MFKLKKKKHCSPLGLYTCVSPFIPIVPPPTRLLKAKGGHMINNTLPGAFALHMHFI